MLVALTFVGEGDRLEQEAFTGNGVALQIRSFVGAAVEHEMWTLVQMVVLLQAAV